jgi:hypothetical protein
VAHSRSDGNPAASRLRSARIIEIFLQCFKKTERRGERRRALDPKR